MGNLSTLYYSSGQGVWFLISGAIALIGAAVVAYYFLRPQNRVRYTGLMQKIDAHVNFKSFILPLILKFLYAFSVLYAFFSGIVTIFTGNVWTGILMTVLGPLGVRVAYELILMLFSVLDGIKETNRLLRAGAAPRAGVPQSHARPMHPQAGNEPHADEQKHYPGGYDAMHKG